MESTAEAAPEDRDLRSRERQRRETAAPLPAEHRPNVWMLRGHISAVAGVYARKGCLFEFVSLERSD